MASKGTDYRHYLKAKIAALKSPLVVSSMPFENIFCRVAKVMETRGWSMNRI